MVIDPIVARLLLAVAVAMLMLGAVTAWTSTNFIKRVAGLLVASLGALCSAAALSAGQRRYSWLALLQHSRNLSSASRSACVCRKPMAAPKRRSLTSADDANEPAEPKA